MASNLTGLWAITLVPSSSDGAQTSIFSIMGLGLSLRSFIKVQQHPAVCTACSSSSSHGFFFVIFGGEETLHVGQSCQ